MTEKAGKYPLIGIFDSGVGGFSVLRAIRKFYPQLPMIYVGDQAHVPYGPKPIEQIQQFSQTITSWLLARGAGLVVVACNTASAVALYRLREVFPHIPFVGMEPAVKPAAETTRTGKVGVLATPATFQGRLYASVVERFARDVVIYQDICTGLVEEIEKGNLQGQATRRILEKALNPMLKEGIDTVVMGCTHYPFVIPLISEIAGPGVRVIDPAPAVARQVGRLLSIPEDEDSGDPSAKLEFFTTGTESSMRNVMPGILGEEFPVHSLCWLDDSTIKEC